MNASYYVARDLLGVVLLASGAGKLADIGSSAILLLRLGMRSKQTAERVSLLLACIEIAVAFGIFSGQLLVLMDLVVLSLFVVFFAVMVYATRVAGGTRCRCFGALSSTAVGQGAILRNAVFVALSAGTLAAHAGDVEPLSGAWSVPMVLVAGLFACACAMAARALDRTWEVRG